MLKKCCFLLVCSFLWVFGAVAASANPVAAQLRAKYDGMQSMQAVFTQQLLHKESGSREKRSGVLYFKKPLLLFWETKTPSPELLILNEKFVWNVFPDEEIAYKYAADVASGSQSIVRVITGQVSLDTDFYVEDAGKEGGLTKLKLYPKEPTQGLVEALLWVDQATHLISKVRIYDFYGNENEIAFSKITPQAQIANSRFNYTPPKDFVLEDKSKDKNAVPKNAIMR